MNIERLRAAVNVLPEQMNMDSWWCGTAGCIAGNCLAQAGVPERDRSVKGIIQGVAAELLGLDKDQACRLFYVNLWPEIFTCVSPDYTFVNLRVADANGNPLTPGTPEYLARVQERVEHFIATEGRE